MINGMADIKRAPLAEAEYGLELEALNVPASPRRVPTELLALGDLDRLTLSWSDLNVYIPRKKKACGGSSEKSPLKQILRNVNGIVRAGECMALMGASGAGKTTLLNTLNGRNRGKIHMNGVIAVNGRKVGGGMTAISGYVQQVDLFIPTVTVREHLQFHASLRMDRTISPKERHRRVEEVIADLGLTKCANSLIGGGRSAKGISGGEVKRLAFACEVLTDPPLLFCDEPTSGLDTFMAQTVVDVMKTLASRGKTVICTIHQPSSEIFVLFDQLMLLAEGRVAFLGPREEATRFFDHTLNLPVPVDYNPADFFIHTLAILPEQEGKCKEKVEIICDTFAQTRSNIAVIAEARKLSAEAGENELVHSIRSPYKATWIEQTGAVLWRTGAVMWREPMLFRVRLFQVIALGLMFGLIYHKAKMTNEGVMNINGLIYMFLMQMTMGNVFAVVSTFTSELPIFLKEHHSGMYRSDVYFLCKMLVDLPVFLLIPFVFVTMVYWLAGLYPSAQAYFVACGICALVANVAVSFGYIASCAFATTQLALAVGMTALMPLTLFGGLFLSLRSIPVWLKWIEYISWFRYANEALAINQWENVEHIDCTISNYTCASNGPEVLTALNFDTADYAFDIAILFAMIAAFRSIAYTALYFRVQR